LILITSIYINPVAIKNKELREYIIGKDDFEYAAHTNRTDDFAIERRTKFNKAIQSRPYHGKKHYVMQAEKKVFTENSLHI
jgi:hypothetical protein